MSGDSGDSSSDFSAKPSCSRRITRRCSRNAASSSSSLANLSGTNAAGGGKKKRRIVMRIEFDDDSDESSYSGVSSRSRSSSVISDHQGVKTRNASANKTKKNAKNSIADDDDEIKPCSSRKLRGKIGKKTNFVFSSDEDGSSNSDIDVPGASIRRRNNRQRNRQTLEDDDDDDNGHNSKSNSKGNGNNDAETSGKGSSHGREIARTAGNQKMIKSEKECDNNSAAAPSTSQQNRDDDNGFNSDSSSNELLEKCPICLLTFRTQQIGSPATCEHIFCATCIEAWSKNVQTCPIDRIEFDRIIVRESYENRELVREINISKTNGAEKLNQDFSDEDVTHCEVCSRTDREDVMLLCDSCNQGYHIDCLSPPLLEIPEGSWYCDNCFDSENGDTDLAEDLNDLYEDIRDMGIPESRYRVTEVHQPRILRTRQNERIRAAILSRTRSGARNQTNEEAPSSSRTASNSRSTMAIRNSSRATRTVKSRRRRRRRARQRTYVVEYDLNNYDEKFAIKTTKRVIRRRRRRSRRTIRSCRDTENSRRMTASKRLAEQLGVKSTERDSRLAPAAQTLSIFGNANDLEYFSDSDDGGLQSEIQIETGGGGTASVQTSVRISNYRTHRGKKGLLSRLEREQPSSTPDLLSNIMDMQDRWHNASRHFEAVRIGQDGSLNLPPASNPIVDPSPSVELSTPNTQPANTVNPSDVTQAPMYPRGGGANNRNFNSSNGANNSGGGGSGSNNYNNRYNNQSNYRGGGSGGNSGGGSGQFRSSFGGSSSGGGGIGGNLFNMVGRGNFSFSSPNYNQNQNQNSNQNQNQDNENNNSNNTLNNRDRFNPRNNNNRNQRNSLPLFNNSSQSNESMPSINVCQPPPQMPTQMTAQLPPQIPPPRQNIPIQPVQSIQPLPQFPIPTHSSHQLPQIQPLQSMSMPPPIFNNPPPTSGPPPMFGPPNMPLPAILSQPPPIIPMHQQPPPATATSTMPPLTAPPAFNSSLFQLTADYGNDDDDDSNCPNFSVYSMESLQVAKSDVKAAAESKGETPKEDDENEDLVQLSDDDEMMGGTNEDDIPLPPEIDKNKNNSDETTKNDSDLYEPDQPTLESDDESEDNENKDQSNDENTESQKPPENDMEVDSDDTVDNLIERPSSEAAINKDENEEQKKLTQANAEESDPNGDDKDDDDDDDDDDDEDERISLSDIKLPEEAPKIPKIKGAQRKGVLELYDDSDWEELNMEKPTAEQFQIKPLSQETKSPENNEKHDEDVDNNEEGEEEDEDKELEKCEDNEENESFSPPHPRPSSTIYNEEKTDEKEEEDEEDREQDRSYTPCLDEKNDDIDEEGACTPEIVDASAISNDLTAAKDANTSDQTAADDTAGIGELETELISEDDDAEKRDKNKRNKGGKDKDKEQFKKVSKNQKIRNYRSDRSPRLRRRRSRSRTNDKENYGIMRGRGHRGRFRRREIPRYNVRNIVNQQRSFKDRYGRDTSRPARSLSPKRRRRSFSRSMSRSKSRSRSGSSPNKRARRSFTISPSPPRYPINRRQSMSPRRRSHSPISRTPIRRQSRTPLRMRSQSRSRSRSRSRSNTPVRRPNKHKNKKAQNKRTSASPVRRSRSLSRFTPRLSRSRTPPRHKPKKTKDRKKKKNKKRQASPSQRSHSRASRLKNPMPPNKRKRHHTPKNKSPVADQGWSPSPSPPRNYMHDNMSWTPPLMSPVGVSRLRRNEDYNEFSIPSKPPKDKKKRDKKKKKSEKRRKEATRKENRRRDPTANAPSKEVFASGNNILVSVSFNKDGNQPQQTTVVTLPPTREEVLANIRGRSKERQNDQQANKKKKKKDGRERKRKKLDTKPVAIIDLERSPFQVTQEQTDVIVLTDSEAGANDEENLNVSRESANEMMTEIEHHHPREGSSHRTVNSDKTPPLDRLEAMMEQSYENAIQQQGPKTPPEPPGGIKFNLINKKQKSIRNAMHDEAEMEFDEPQEGEIQEERDSIPQSTNKIGPNTPPESGPCSPDVYDPFDPTKSPSMSPRSPTPPPDLSHDSVPDDVPSKHSTEDLRAEARIAASSNPAAPEKNALNPVDLVMALMNNKANVSQDPANKSNESQYSSNQTVVNLVDENDKPEESSSSLGITVLSNVILTSAKPQHIPIISSPPLSKASSQMHKPPQKLTNILSNLPGLGNRMNGGGGIDDMLNDIESPYSPGSADYEDLFEPPPDTNGTKRRNEKRPKKTGDIFESLFGSSSPPPAGAAHLKLSNVRKYKSAHMSSRNKHKMIVKVSKLPGTNTDDHVKVYDDLPNSAVELQVKDKFLRKLNRQERVVEEVKLILKPRFNKKQITKDDYKEIMRRAVPKICHSRSGEINPKKIQNLIEAYVKKFRQKHKKLNIPNTGQVSSAVKCAAYLKKL